MAQFKFIGHSNGAAPEHASDAPVQIQGVCQLGKLQKFELEVMPNEVFELADSWEMAISSLLSTERNGKPMYARV